jgi:hypothetical protein
MGFYEYWIEVTCMSKSVATMSEPTRARSAGLEIAVIALIAATVACGTSIAQTPRGGSEAPPRPALHIESAAPAHPALRIPDVIRAEHDELHEGLAAASHAPGAVGDSARALAGILEPHFEREEQIALPPLGLLAPLAAGDFSPTMRAVLPMTDALRRELSQMLHEHERISDAARRLQVAAHAAGDRQVEGLAEALLAHAQVEEAIYYPAAILVGDMVRARAEE